MTDYEKVARDLIENISDFHSINCCGGDYCEYSSLYKSEAHVHEKEDAVKIMTQALRTAVKKEREECADIVENISLYYARELAQAIRNRGKDTPQNG